jgi:AcrR family transcriptional regulator
MSKHPLSALDEKPKARPKGRSERVGEDVLKAVIEILADTSGKDLTFEAVAARANVNRTTLYRRWGNKSRLLAWALLAFAEEQAPPPDLGSLREDLVALILALDSMLAGPLGLQFIRVFAIDARQDADVGAAVDDYWKQRYSNAADIAARAIQRGELPKNVDLQAFFERVFGPFYYQIMVQRGRLTRADVEKIVDRALSSLR